MIIVYLFVSDPMTVLYVADAEIRFPYSGRDDCLESRQNITGI